MTSVSLFLELEDQWAWGGLGDWEGDRVVGCC